LRLRSSQYQLINEILLRNKYDGVILQFLENKYVDKVLSELHDGLVGGNFFNETFAHKILGVGYYWPTFFKDAHAYAWRCKIFQKCVGHKKKPIVPL